NADADLAAFRFPRLKTEIARREIKLLVVERVVGDMHLAIFPEHFSAGIDDRSSVVVEAGSALFEKRGHDYDLELACQFFQGSGRGPRNFFGQVEIIVLLGLAEILRTKELRQTNDLRALLGRLANESDRVREVLLRVRSARHLDESDFGDRGFRH